jgi:hypothetical protein
VCQIPRLFMGRICYMKTFMPIVWGRESDAALSKGQCRTFMLLCHRAIMMSYCWEQSRVCVCQPPVRASCVWLRVQCAFQYASTTAASSYKVSTGSCTDAVVVLFITFLGVSHDMRACVNCVLLSVRVQTLSLFCHSLGHIQCHFH